MSKEPRQPAGMNIFGILGFLLLCGGLVWGLYAAAGQGLWAAVRGGLLGLAKAFIIFAVFMFLIMVPLSLGLLYRPTHPRCRRGPCRDKDFRYLYLDQPPPPRDAEIEKQCGGKLVQCACGDRYIRSDRERRFYEIREDGSAVPFMRYRFAGRWRGIEADAESGHRPRETP